MNIQAQILQRLGLSGRNPVTPSSSSHSRSMSLFPSATTLVNRDNSLARKLLNLNNSSADNNNNNNNNASNYFEDLLSAAAPDGVTNTGSQQNQQDYSTSEFYAQRLQSFYPSCSAPNETDESSWKSTNGRQMRLHFEVNIPRSHNVRTHVTIMWAKLRLYLFAAPGCATNRIGTSTGKFVWGPSLNNDNSQWETKPKPRAMDT